MTTNTVNFTVKSFREPRKGRRRKTSDIKACKKKAWKSKSKTLRRMAALLKEKKRKGEKNQIKTILLNSIQVETSEPYEENVVRSWVGETTNSVTKRAMIQKGQAGKETH